MTNIHDAVSCKRLWNSVICAAIDDAIRPFTMVLYDGEDYKKSFARQYKNFLKREKNPFDIPEKFANGDYTALETSRARIWFERQSQDFVEVCHYAGIDDPENLSNKVMQMCALVDDYKNRYETEGKKQHEGKDSKYIVFLATNEQVMQCN